MPLMDLPAPSGKCPHCTVNLYSIDGETPHPVKMPCLVSRTKGEEGWKEESFVCPYETAEEQEKARQSESWEFLRGFLGKDAGNTFYEG